MKSYLIICTFLCCVGSFPFHVNSQTRDEDLFLGKYPIPKNETRDPINIQTEKVKHEKLPPLKILNINFNDSMNLTNNGLAIEAIVDQNTKQIITGGPYFNDEYNFLKARFYFSNSSKIPAGTTINGVGTPIEVIVYGYNKKYVTFNNALRYPDGVAVVSIGITVGSKRNKKFPQFSKELQKIKYPGSSIIVPHKDTALWYDIIPEDEYYYAYPGAYTDLVGKKVYYSATVCILRPVNAYISETQFKNSFGNLKDSNGGQLTRSNRTTPLNGRPVVESRGYEQTVVH